MYQVVKTKLHNALIAIDAKWDALPQSFRTNVISAWNSFMAGFLGTLVVILGSTDISNIEVGAIAGIFAGALNAAIRGGVKSLFTFIGDYFKSKVTGIKELRGTTKK